MSRILGVIPARIGSSRLPRKPLQPLMGRPLVTWVWERARAMDVLDRVVVATDSREVAEACTAAGAPVVMTSPDHASGTDRVWEAAERTGEDYGIVVNIQGDEPFVEEAVVRAAAAMVVDRGFDAGTCAVPLRDEREFRDPAAVKVVRALDGRALYFSRAPIPFPQGGQGEAAGPRLRHVGVYAYRREALGRWVGFARSRLEREESLEQLRALENGITIGVAVVASAAAGVDTPDDLARAERRLRRLHKGTAQDDDAQRS